MIEKETIDHPTGGKQMFITLHGKRQSMADWSRDLDINLATLHRRVNNGWTESELLRGRRISQAPLDGRVICDMRHRRWVNG